MIKSLTAGRAAAYPALVLGCSMALPVSAANFAFETVLGAGHSDNIRLVPTNKEDEDILSAEVRFSVDQQSSRLRADAVGDFAYAEYLNDTYDSEWLGNFTGNARFAFVPQRFEWVMSDTFGQTLSDPFAAQTPDNRENINYFTTGPDVTLALGSISRLRLGARYSLATYEDNDLDFDIVGAEAALVRPLSSASEVSLNVRSSQIRYDNAALDGDYDQSDAFLGYSVQGARTRLGIEAGYTVIDRKTSTVAEEEQDGLLLRLNAVRRVTAASSATLMAGREFSNSGTSFADSQSLGSVSSVQRATAGRQTAQPFVQDSVSLAWNFARNRSSFGFSASWSEQSYEDASELDQTLTEVSAYIGRELSPRTSVNLQALFNEADFQQSDADYDELDGRATFSWRVSPRVSINTSYDYVKRNSDFAGGDATENRYQVAISYGRGTLRSALSAPQFPVDTGT